VSLDWKALFRPRPPVLPRSSSAGGRGRVVRDPAGDARCGIDRTKLGGTKLDGPRPPRAAIDCLASALRAEQVATNDLAAARENVRDCLSAARRDGSSYSSVAAALVRPKSTISETLVARRRMASSLACRAHEARKRSKT
jgi:hypothetical protein